jgi:hypothetical protein
LACFITKNVADVRRCWLENVRVREKLIAQGRNQFAIKGFIGVCFPLNDGVYPPINAIFYAQADTRQCRGAGLETKQMHRAKHL